VTIFLDLWPQSRARRVAFPEPQHWPLLGHIPVTVAVYGGIAIPYAERGMAVRSDGDHWIMEQIGEKQDFESELSRLGLRHEDFELYVRRATFNGTRKVWSTNYAVRVSNSVTGKRNIYWGGPGQDWIAQFVKDVRAGLFGALFPARKPRAAAKPSQPPRRSA